MVRLTAKLLKTIVPLVFMLLLTGCTGSMPYVDQVITNIGNVIPPFWHLITGGAYIFGLMLILRGVYALKVYGDMRTMMSSQANLKGALTCFFIGSVLIFSETMYDALLLSTFNTTSTSPLQYQSNITLSISAYFALLQFVQLIGLISFIRGWVMLTHLSNPSQQHSFGKAMTHIVGGLLAINIQGTINVLQGTIGIT